MMTESPGRPRDERAGQPENMRKPMLELRGLTRTFGGIDVVAGVDLDVAAGEVLAILGPSGCGKTTTLRMIAGFDDPDAGTITMDGNLIACRGKCVPPESRKVGMVFQDGVLFPHLSVGENVAFGVKKEERRDKIDWALGVVGLQGFQDRMPYELSGGQQQRVSLARAIAPEPRIILLDEPFASLDAALRNKLRTEVRQMLSTIGATAIWVTHDQEEALSLADKVAVMMNGTIEQVAGPEELYHRPVSRRVGSFVGDAQFLSGTASNRRVWCELGELPAIGVSDGIVDIMIRPEALRLTPESQEQRANAIVIDRLFYGHDQLLRLRLASGTEINARLGSYGGIRPGDSVWVSVRGAVLALPPADSSA